LTICEGRYHQLKRMFAALGNLVVKLHRERFGALNLSEMNLNEGEFRQLTADELLKLNGG
ncbi:MAG: 16S rRNA pseudouridine(516) synthase, partial [Venatoribacter sp.]